MPGFVKDAGVGGAIGLIIGLCAIAWVAPETGGGIGLLIVTCTAVVTIIGAVFGLFRSKPAAKPRK